MVKKMYSKKGISPVVAMGLLLVVAVVSVASFMSWYSQYSSQLFTGAEQDSNTISSQIVDLRNGKLYFKSSKEQIISQIEVANNNCLNQTNASKGMNTINISSCLNNVSGKYQAVVVADRTYSKYFYEEGVLSFSDSNQKTNNQRCRYRLNASKQEVQNLVSDPKINLSEDEQTGYYTINASSKDYYGIPAGGATGQKMDFSTDVTSVEWEVNIPELEFANDGIYELDLFHLYMGDNASQNPGLVSTFYLNVSSFPETYYVEIDSQGNYGGPYYGQLGQISYPNTITSTFVYDANSNNIEVYVENSSVATLSYTPNPNFLAYLRGSKTYYLANTYGSVNNSGKKISGSLITDAQNMSSAAKGKDICGNEISSTPPQQTPPQQNQTYSVCSQPFTNDLAVHAPNDYLNYSISGTTLNATTSNQTAASTEFDYPLKLPNSGIQYFEFQLNEPVDKGNRLVGFGDYQVYEDGQNSNWERGLYRVNTSNGWLMLDGSGTTISSTYKDTIGVGIKSDGSLEFYINGTLEYTMASGSIQDDYIIGFSGNYGPHSYNVTFDPANFKYSYSNEQAINLTCSASCPLQMGANLSELQTLDSSIQKVANLSNNKQTMSFTFEGSPNNSIVWGAAPSGISTNSSEGLNFSEGIRAYSYSIDKIPKLSSPTQSQPMLSIYGLKDFKNNNTHTTSLMVMYKNQSYGVGIAPNGSSSNSLQFVSPQIPRNYTQYFNANTQKFGLIVDGVDYGYQFNYTPGESVPYISFAEYSSSPSSFSGEKFQFSLRTGANEVLSSEKLPSGTTDMCGNSIN